MITAVLERLSDKARAAMHWALFVALREGQKEIGPRHFLAGIQCARPQLFKDVDISRLGFVPLDVSHVEQIQAEMQKLYMQASIASAKEDSPGAMGFMFPFSPKTKVAFDTAASCSDSLGTRSIATPHLLYGLLESDPELDSKLELAGLGKARALSLCREYKDGAEGESMAQQIESFRGTRSFRSGIGYDLHRLDTGRKLIVGGIELPFDKGPVGHSDGDVLAHAVCDALLGAAGLGDIGTHFPDTDPKWKDASSLLFLNHAGKLLDEQHFAIEWIDAVVITEKPKLGPHFPRMREALSKALGVSVDHIHLKAKTNEGVDAIGRGEAIAAHVVATLSKQ